MNFVSISVVFLLCVPIHGTFNTEDYRIICVFYYFPVAVQVLNSLIFLHRKRLKLIQQCCGLKMQPRLELAHKKVFPHLALSKMACVYEMIQTNVRSSEATIRNAPISKSELAVLCTVFVTF